MATSKTHPEGYKRTKTDDGIVYRKMFSNGGHVDESRYEFFAYDRSGNYLGWDNQEKAEKAAETGRVLCTTADGVCDLDLWLVWNAARDAEIQVMLSPAGWQIIHLRDDIFMAAREVADGYEIKLIEANELHELYGDDDDAQEPWLLTIASREQVLRLE